MTYAFALLSFVALSLEGLSTTNELGKEQVWISPSPLVETRIDKPGTVFGTCPCGGIGQLIEVRMEGCTNSTNTLCHLTSESPVRPSEMEFIPSKSIWQMRFRIFLTVERNAFPVMVYDSLVENSTVIVGVPHTIYIRGETEKALRRALRKNLKKPRRKITTVRYVLYDAESNVAEVCAESYFVLV